MRSLQLDFVQQNGYVNLRCNPNPGCLSPATDRISWVTDEVWREVFAVTSTSGNSTQNSYSTVPVSGRSAAVAQQQQVLKAPELVSAACCAQFAMSRDQVLKRPLEDYIQFRDWVIKTDRNDQSSGRAWSIFGIASSRWTPCSKFQVVHAPLLLQDRLEHFC